MIEETLRQLAETIPPTATADPSWRRKAMVMVRQARAVGAPEDLCQDAAKVLDCFQRDTIGGALKALAESLGDEPRKEEETADGL